MAESAPLSPPELRQILVQRFDEEELRDLCFDLNVDYDGLRGEGKISKARELVTWFERNGRLPELESTICSKRASLQIAFSPDRVQKLEATIKAEAKPAVRDAFDEFTQQIASYLDEFRLLHKQLEEWKEVHNLLQDVQNDFAPCRGYIYALEKLQGPARAVKRQQADMLYRIEVYWESCKRRLGKLQELASDIRAIGEPFEPKSGSGPDWFLQIRASALEVDQTLHANDADALSERMSAFGDVVDNFLYMADKSLRDVVSQINQLPSPGSFRKRSA